MNRGELWVEWRRTNHLVLVEITDTSLCRFHRGPDRQIVEGVIVSGPKIGDAKSWDYEIFKRRFKKINIFNKGHI